MRKFILTIAILMAAASFSANYNQAMAQGSNESETMTVADSTVRTHRRSHAIADSIRSKGARWGKKVANGTAMVVDSAGPTLDRAGEKMERVSEKTKVKADTALQRSRRAWKVLRGKQ